MRWPRNSRREGQCPVSGAMIFATTDARPVRCSSASANAVATSPRLLPMKRSGSGSHRGERWPTHGNAVSTVDAPVIRSASVRPVMLVVLRPSPTYPPVRAIPVVAS